VVRAIPERQSAATLPKTLPFDTGAGPGSRFRDGLELRPSSGARGSRSARRPPALHPCGFGLRNLGDSGSARRHQSSRTIGRAVMTCTSAIRPVRRRRRSRQAGWRRRSRTRRSGERPNELASDSTRHELGEDGAMMALSAPVPIPRRPERRRAREAWGERGGQRSPQ